METQHQVMGYDRAATLFSPQGKLLQVEYAEKASSLGADSVGLVCSDGILIVADRPFIDPLITSESVSKIYEIDNHVIGSAAGILSDARVLMERAQLVAQQHRVTFNTPIEVESVIKDIANLKQAYTQFGGARPFGVHVMIAGIDADNEGRMFVSEVTGNYFGYKATAIGQNEDKIKEILKDQYKESITIEQGIKLVLSIFKKILAKNFDMARLEAFYVRKDKKMTVKLIGDKLSKYTK